MRVCAVIIVGSLATRSAPPHQVNELRLRIGELEEEIENKANEISDLKAKAEDMEHDHNIAKDKLMDDVQHFRTELEDARDALQEAEREQSRLEGEVRRVVCVVFFLLVLDVCDVLRLFFSFCDDSWAVMDPHRRL
jgi:predicted RNase H-like nuclease (RuvC/YqgF family)